MHRKIFIEQLKRSKKTVVYFWLLLIAATFFVTSMNLYRNSIRNLQISESTFSTLAVTELYGEVDRYGKLVERNSEEHIGYQPVGVRGYDISKIIDSEAVRSYDLRTQYGAYIEECPAMFYAPQVNGDGTDIPQWFMRSNNIIRFQIQAKEPLELKYHYDLNNTKEYHFGLNVLDEAAGCFEYPEKMFYYDLGFKPEEWEAREQDIKDFNQTEDTDCLILYPGVEYVAIIEYHGYWLWNEDGTLEYTTTSDGYETTFDLVVPLQDYRNIQLTYDGGREGMEYEVGDTPFPIQRWEDVQNDPKLKAYFEDLWQDIQVQQYTHNVVATNDVTSVPTFHLGNTALCEGRLITEEEYESGAKVCLISKEVAQNQQWKIGDKLNMKLFESDYIPNAPFVPDEPIYDAEKTPFVDEGEYEIVGIYESYPSAGNTELAPDTLELSPFTIFVPTNSIAKPREQKDVMVHGSTFSVKIKNGSVEDFVQDMEANGVTTGGKGEYTPKFTFYDQGYSAVKSSLLSMNNTAKLLLLLSSILLLIICVLVAYFFWQNQRQTVGIFRLLGGTKKQAVSAVLLCAMVLTILGSAAGGISGYGLAYIVGNGIMQENIEEIEMDMSQENDLSALTEQESDIRVAADPLVTLQACGALLLCPVFLLGFALPDINREPRELLPKNK